jgi:hypothetical protein
MIVALSEIELGELIWRVGINSVLHMMRLMSVWSLRKKSGEE